MSLAYNEYLNDHKANVAKGYYWLRENLPEIATPRMEWQICFNHDTSKTGPDEYEAYDEYFYGRNKSYEVVQNFKRAWLHHIHQNPHHWQHWILINDDADEGELIMDMDDIYIVEMVCDWWSFSWKKENPHEIFKWYDEHKEYMKLSKNTRKKVEDILAKIKSKLEEP